MKNNHLYFSLLIAFLLAGCQPSASPTAKPEKPESKIPEPKIEGMSSDFDFAIGEWKVTNRRRKEWLNNNDEWYEFPATVKIWKHLGGMMILDEFYTNRNGQENIGGSFRVYNKNTGEWSLFFASTAYPDLGLIPQVKGKFENGVGTFFGEEEFKGKTVRLRFQWIADQNGSPHWEQAYFDDAKGKWETNWTMDFERLECGMSFYWLRHNSLFFQLLWLSGTKYCSPSECVNANLLQIL